MLASITRPWSPGHRRIDLEVLEADVDVDPHRADRVAAVDRIEERQALAVLGEQLGEAREALRAAEDAELLHAGCAAPPPRPPG